MAGTAVSRGLTSRRAWRPACLVDRRQETSSAQTLVFDVERWPGHVAGQHLDLRLTAPDGYQATRSYSLAAPAQGTHIEITVQRTSGGEVSPFLTDALKIGGVLEVRGPLGGWFIWTPEQPEPVLLVGGGSGVVPLMAMIRARPPNTTAGFSLLGSVKSPDDRLYASELEQIASADDGVAVQWIYTRHANAADARSPGRLTGHDLEKYGWSPEVHPTCYVCGPTGFVESAAELLLAAGHPASRIRTERFGGA